MKQDTVNGILIARFKGASHAYKKAVFAVLRQRNTSNAFAQGAPDLAHQSVGPGFLKTQYEYHGCYV